MNHEAHLKIQRELDSGEKLIWADMPKQGVIFRGFDVFMIPFSLLWGGFAIFWEIMALSIPNEEAGAAGYVFPLFGIPFVLIGLYLIFGRFVHDSKRRANTFYGLTNQRAIMISGLFNKEVKSLNLASLSDVSLTEKGDMSGTITFGQENLMTNFLFANNFPGMGMNTVPKFELIENAKEVYNKIREQQK